MVSAMFPEDLEQRLEREVVTEVATEKKVEIGFKIDIFNRV